MSLKILKTSKKRKNLTLLLIQMELIRLSKYLSQNNSKRSKKCAIKKDENFIRYK